jgi:hypothetical protein
MITVVKIHVGFWVMTACSPKVDNQCFRLCDQPRRGSIGTDLPNYMVALLNKTMPLHYLSSGEGTWGSFPRVIKLTGCTAEG